VKDYSSLTALKNSSTVTIFTSRNGLSTSRSLSPLTMYFAPPFNASSKILSSFGSRHSCTFSIISTSIARSTNVSKNLSRSSLVTKRLNFSRPSTSLSSYNNSSDNKTSPCFKAYRNAFEGLPFSNSNELTITFVSKT
jgi:hypothetical protein